MKQLERQRETIQALPVQHTPYLLLNNPKDIMSGTKIYNGVVYAYVTVLKGESTKDDLKYADGYIDQDSVRYLMHIKASSVSKVSSHHLTRMIRMIRI